MQELQETPAACGVLPIAIGKATRLIEYMSEADRSYRAELTFGFETDSGVSHRNNCKKG